MRKLLPILIFIFFLSPGHAQISKGKQGAWCIFIWNVNTEKSKLGFKGDIQYRNWNLLGDLEQLIIRDGITYPLKNSNIGFVLRNVFSKKMFLEPGLGICYQLISFLSQKKINPEKCISFFMMKSY